MEVETSEPGERAAPPRMLTLDRRTWSGLAAIAIVSVAGSCRHVSPRIRADERGIAAGAVAEPARAASVVSASGGSAGASQSSIVPLIATPPASAPLSAAARPSLPPLQNVNWLEFVTLPDGGVAAIMPPVGAREPRPLLIAVHGAGDRADWACGGWRLAASEYPFVVCPQGSRFDAHRFAWDSPHTVARRVRAAIEAARSRFGPYIAEGPIIYAGFSQGATLAGPTLLETPQRFPVVALAEGGYDLLRDPAMSKQLKAQGTGRVMIVCGTPGCFRTAHNVEGNLTTVGIEPLIAGDPRAGHNLNLEMQRALQAAFPAFTAGLASWRGFSEHLAQAPR